jgi:hypothetical protein
MNLYLIGAALVVLTTSTGGAYFKGRSDGVAAVKAAQLDEYKNAVKNAVDQMGLRATADQTARLDAERFSTRVRKDLAKVREDFHALPQVIVKSDGCPDLSDAFRLRWDAAERSASDLGSVTGRSGAVRDDALPVAR